MVRFGSVWYRLEFLKASELFSTFRIGLFENWFYLIFYAIG